MICFIIIKELYDLTLFAFNYHSIYNVAKINKMPCGNLHTEFETPRFQISKNIYNLHMDNDIYNSKSYIIIIFVFSIIFFLYSLVILYDYNDILKINNNISFLDNILPSLLNIKLFKKFFIVCLILSFIVYYSIAMAKRFGNDGIEGYYGPSNDRYGYDVSLYTIIAIILTVNIVINLIYSFDEKLYFNIPITILSSLLVVFAFFFMNNLFNIVMSFQDNQDVKDKDNGGDAHYDISYGNENLFYKRYLNRNNFKRVYDIYHDIFNIDKEIWGYDNTAYNISKGGEGDNLPMYTGKIRNFLLIIFIFIIIVLFVIILLLVYRFINEKDKNIIDGYILFFMFDIIAPLFLIFAVIFVIIASMQYNTFINKDILLNLNGYYKYDLNKLNNSVVPALYIADKTKISDNDKTGRYIVYNVMISYFINSINILDNSKTLNTQYLFINDKYIDNTLNTFYENTDNDINDEYKFKVYTDSIKANIDDYWKYENTSNILNNYKVLNKDNVSYNSSIFNINENDISYITSNINGKVVDTKKENIKENIKDTILYSLYYLYSDNFDSKYKDINIGKVDDDNKSNSDIKTNLHNNILFLNNKKDTAATKNISEYDDPSNKAIYSYKFILKGPLNDSIDDMVSIKAKPNRDSLIDKYKYYENDIDNLIDNFLNNMEILYKHLYLFKLEDIVSSDKNKVKIAGIIINFKDIIHQNLISDIEVLNNKIKEAGDINENALFKKIKAMYNQFNGEKLDNISLYEKNDNQINILENSKEKYAENTINNTFNSNILDNIIDESTISNKNAYDNANFVIKERLVVLFSTYCITLLISYKLLNNF